MNATPQIGYQTLALEYAQTYEQWLEWAAAMMREGPIRQLAGHRCRVSCGWPYKATVAHAARRGGECWYPEHSVDHTSHNLFISPALQDPIEVLQALAHELIHVAAGPNVGHKVAEQLVTKLTPRCECIESDELLEQWLARGIITERFNINGSVAWSTLNKLAVHVGSGIPLDLFATTAERWFVSLVVPTGSKEMNTTLAGSALRREMQLHVYGVLENTKTGEQIIPQSEREVFERLGVPYREPAER